MIIFPGILETFRSLKDRSFRITFATNELTPEQSIGITQNTGEYGYMAFKKEPFKSSEKDMIEAMETDYEVKGKSQSQRIRAILYLLWKENKEGYEDFNLYYDFKTEKYIQYLKNKLP